jgi:predicted lipoprotein with Yx(FWY)xxD motif
MSSTRRELLATVAASATVAGCLSGDSGTPTGTETEGETDDTATDTTTATSDGATVQVRDHDDHGEILVGPDGTTLYMFDSDTQGSGESTCSGDCADAWPPLTVDGDPTAGDGVTAELSTFEREDGGTQVVAGGWPLYYFQNDGSPGDANGQGVQDVWWVLAPDGTPMRDDGPSPTPTETETASY